MLLSVMFFVIGIILTGVGIIYILKIINPNATPKKRWNLDSSTKGTILFVEQITKHNYNEEDSYSYNPTVRYYVNGKKYVSKTQVTPFRSSEWAYAKQGDIIDVWYDSNNPERFWATQSEEIRERISGFDKVIYKYILPFFIFAGAIMVFGCAIFGPDKFFAMFPG